MSSYRLEINPDDPHSIQRALKTEWLLTNGLGGYAMGTTLGVNTRRYHGLLVAATKPPVGRIVALHSMIEQLIIPDEDGSEKTFDLWTQQFGDDGLLHSNGRRWLCEFQLNLPNDVRWVFQLGRVRVTKTVAFRGVRNSVRVSYKVTGLNSSADLRLRPIIALRDFHSLGGHQSQLDQPSECCDDYITFVSPSGEFLLGWSDARWQSDAQWWRQFCYAMDRHRKQDFLENLWSPGYVTAPASAAAEIEIVAGQASPNLAAKMGFEGPKSHRLARAAASSPSAVDLVCGAESFVVQRHHRDKAWASSVIAGYPWFGDWGRDTMIALPGLMLSTGRFDEARSCLMLYAQHLRNGLIPNVFDDYGGAAHYNTADASLWFVHAVHALWKSQEHVDNELLFACREIIRAYQNGTDFNIFMDDDGLISAGDEGSQLTWMDAKRDGVIFTPRHGKAVEINALWFNALNCLAAMTDDLREREDLRVLSRKAAESFRAKFWWEDRACLYDVLIPRETASGKPGFVSDRRIRPNQIFAVSLPFSPLDANQQRAVARVIEEKLLTPFGLRTLDRNDPDYRSRYEGNMFERDRAYHNGTVWPWLIGPFCEAVLRVEGFSPSSKRRVRAILQPLIDEMSNTEGGRCLGQIAEVYDGDPPHLPGGCPAQAWSIAEVLRILSLIESSQGTGT